MKLSRMMRLIGLSLALVLLIAVGIGGGIWYFGRNAEEALTPEFSGVEQAGMMKKGKIYQETLVREIDPPGSWGNIIAYPNGMAILIIRENNAWIEDLLTGEKVMDIPAEWMENGRLQEVTFDSEGACYGVVISGDGQIKLLSSRENSSAKEIFLEGTTERITKLMVKGHYFYCTDSNNFLSIYDLDGTIVKKIGNAETFYVDGKNRLYVLGIYAPMLRVFDMEEDKALYSESPLTHSPVKYPPQEVYNLSYDEKSDILYLGGGSFVQTFQPDNGEFLDNVLDCNRDTADLGNYYPGMWVDERQTLYFTCWSQPINQGKHENLNQWPGLKLRVYRYDIAEDPKKDLPYTLTVTAPYRSDYMARVIQQFETENPGQKVKYNYAYNSRMEFTNNADRDGFFDRWRLELLTGDAGDILMTGGAWSDIYHYFANTDLFVDLKPKLTQSESYKELDQGLLDSVMIQGQIKGVPFATDYYYAQIDPGICEQLNIDLDWNHATWSDVLGLLEKFEGTDYYLFDVNGNTERAFTRMLISNMPDLIDREEKTMDLRQPWFLDLLKQWKAAENHPNFAKKNGFMWLTGKGLISIDGMTNGDSEEEETLAPNSFYEITGNQLEICPLFLGEQSANRTATSSDLYSICAQSKNKEMAWKLLNVGLRKEIMEQRALSVGPLNREARQERICRVIDSSGEDQQRVAYFYNQMNQVYGNVDALYDMEKIKEDLYKKLWNYVRKGSDADLDEILNQAEQSIWLKLNE